MSKEIVEGYVEIVVAKELPEPDRYGNNYRLSVKMDNGQFYGLGTGKRDSINVKDGAGWHQLAKGDKIEFVAESRESNGRTFWNASKKTLTLKEKGNGGNGSTASRGSSSGSTRGSYADGGVNYGIAVGHAINNAVMVLGNGASVSDIKNKAIEIFQLSMEMQEEAKKGLYDKRNNVIEEKNQENQSRQADEDFDDDLPFS